MLICLCMSFMSMAAVNTYVFVSFSMPETLMIETLQECERLHIPAILNGLYQNSMPETAKQIMVLSNQIPNLSLQIESSQVGFPPYAPNSLDKSADNIPSAEIIRLV